MLAQLPPSERVQFKEIMGRLVDQLLWSDGIRKDTVKQDTFEAYTEKK